jgi:hypothetical protein
MKDSRGYRFLLGIATSGDYRGHPDVDRSMDPNLYTTKVPIIVPIMSRERAASFGKGYEYYFPPVPATTPAV